MTVKFTSSMRESVAILWCCCCWIVSTGSADSMVHVDKSERDKAGLGISGGGRCNIIDTFPLLFHN